jgi:hypothetical protein
LNGAVAFDCDGTVAIEPLFVGIVVAEFIAGPLVIGCASTGPAMSGAAPIAFWYVAVLPARSETDARNSAGRMPAGNWPTHLPAKIPLFVV